MPTQRYKLVIAYRGTHYHGWQHQAWLANYRRGPRPAEGHGIPTIQEIVSRAIASVVQHPVSLVGSSRTDSGVHAKGQVAHFDTDQVQIPPEGLRRAVNNRLPDDILIRAVEPVSDSFDAILSTVSKRYQYFIWTAYDRAPFYPELCWHRWKPLDFDAMRAATAPFVGQFDFASFARPGHGRENTIRTVLDCQLSRRGPMMVVGIEGGGFLWHMVRIIVGTIVEVGLGLYAPEDVPQMLAARDRRSAGTTAPPQGLYLQWIKTTDGGPAANTPPGARLPVTVAPLIRPYDPGDAAAIVRVAQALPEWFDEAGRRHIALDVPLERGYVAVLGKQVVGFVALVVQDGIATISWMGVLPEYHRRGIGKALLGRMLRDLKRHGIPQLQVHTLGESVTYEPYARTRAFYRSMGFTPIARIPQPDKPGWPERLILGRSV